jgi:hypothetical protein
MFRAMTSAATSGNRPKDRDDESADEPHERRV